MATALRPALPQLGEFLGLSFALLGAGLMVILLLVAALAWRLMSDPSIASLEVRWGVISIVRGSPTGLSNEPPAAPRSPDSSGGPSPDTSSEG